MDTKSWYASKTIWGVVVFAAATIASIAHHPLNADQQADLLGVFTICGQLIGSIMAMYGRWTATAAIGSAPAGTESSGTQSRATGLASLHVLALALGLGTLLMAGGCQATDTPSNYYTRAASTERLVISSVITYEQSASALGVSEDAKRVVLAKCKVATSSIAALTDTMRAASDTYQSARAAGNEQAAAEATDKAKLAFDALNAVATRLMADLTAKGTQ